ncbi:DUF5994 family protein [Nocardia spumae]|uniref:DUF5994 family protein n=1 Tax=Nocardia spumae TaxID=2887190 RepID=UPI001D159897|nr:DUF5994 family protein [Nocardia spumae]
MIRPNNHLPSFHRVERDNSARVQLKSYAVKTGYVDGAWWPRSTDLSIELPGLLAVVSAQLGSIHRVVYDADDWTPAALQLSWAGRTVRLDANRHGTAHTIEVIGTRDWRQILLIIPPATDVHRAHSVLAAACRSNDESTVDELLAPLTRRTGRAAALRRWRNSGTTREFDKPRGTHSIPASALTPNTP